MINNKGNILRVIGIFCFVLLASACSQNSSKNSTAVNSIDQNMDETFMVIENDGITYKIPSPMEVFIFLNVNEAPFILEILHDPAKHQNYDSKKSKAINFGIYAADLAYTSVFGDIQQTLIYFNAAKILASELGLHEGYGQQMALRIDKNLNNLDSLLDITAESYNAANLFLEEQGLTDIMGIIIAGGWIESLFIAIKSVPDANIDDPLVERIVDQQLLLDNLLAQLYKNSDQKHVWSVIERLEELQVVFDQLYFNDQQTLITQEQFVLLSNKVTDIRESFIQ